MFSPEFDDKNCTSRFATSSGLERFCRCPFGRTRRNTQVGCYGPEYSETLAAGRRRLKGHSRASKDTDSSSPRDVSLTHPYWLHSRPAMPRPSFGCGGAGVGGIGAVARCIGHKSRAGRLTYSNVNNKKHHSLNWGSRSFSGYPLHYDASEIRLLSLCRTVDTLDRWRRCKFCCLTTNVNPRKREAN
jgi:hypothetical protein